MIDDKLQRELIQKAHEGDSKAREQLIVDNMPLVRNIANKYKSLDYDTAAQEGCIGLINAVDGFDIDRGFRFSSYAVPLIKGEILRHIRDKREDMPYRIKKYDYENYRKVMEAKEKLVQEFKGNPYNWEIAQYLKITIQEVDSAINAMSNFTSLYRTNYYSGDGEDLLLIDTIKNKKSISEEQIINKIILKEAINQLDKKEREIIELRYYKEATQQEMANKFQISQPVMSRIEKRILNKLKMIILGKKIEEKKTHNIRENNEIICITTGEMFKSPKEASIKIGRNVASLHYHLRGATKFCGKLPDGTKLKWMYCEDYLELKKEIS